MEDWSIERYSTLMSSEDWHTPQNISSSLFPKYGTGNYYGHPTGLGKKYSMPMDIKVSRRIIGRAGPIWDGVHYLAWSDLYPIWQRLGYSRVNPKKGEKCPR